MEKLSDGVQKRHTATHFYHHHHYYYNHSAGIVIQINMAAAIIAVTAAAVAAPLLFNIGHFLSFSHFLSLFHSHCEKKRETQEMLEKIVH